MIMSDDSMTPQVDPNVPVVDPGAPGSPAPEGEGQEGVAEEPVA